MLLLFVCASFFAYSSLSRSHIVQTNERTNKQIFIDLFNGILCLLCVRALEIALHATINFNFRTFFKFMFFFRVNLAKMCLQNMFSKVIVFCVLHPILFDFDLILWYLLNCVLLWTILHWKFIIYLKMNVAVVFFLHWKKLVSRACFFLKWLNVDVEVH